MIIQGDEAGILYEFLFARLRGNASGFDVEPFEHGPDQDYPCYGFSVDPVGSAPEQGGSVLWSTFYVNVMAVGAAGVLDFAPIRAAAKELPELLFVDSTTNLTEFGSGRISRSRQTSPIGHYDTDEHGTRRAYLGSRWEIRVQPDGAIH